MTTIEPQTVTSKHRVVALVGNPNTGKTTLFNALAGMRQRVGNYPGVTVETKKGRMHLDGQTFEIVDLPGTYSLAPRSPDEMVAVDLILGHQPGEPRPDVVVSIVDASNLERNLYLTTQVLELGVPVVVALNMIDLAGSQGLTIDEDRLRRQLGIPVVPIQANKGKGLDRLKQAIADAAAQGAAGTGPAFPEAFEREVEDLRTSFASEVAPFLVRRMLLDIGGYTEQRLRERVGAASQAASSPALRAGLTQVEHGQTSARGWHDPAGMDGRLGALLQDARQRLAEAGCAVPAVEARTRYAWIRAALQGCIQRPVKRPVTWTDRLDRVLTHKLWGTLLFLALMFVVFQSIFEWARPFMKLIAAGKDLLADLLHHLPPGPLTSLLVDGVLEGVGSVVIFLPQIVILFGFIAVLEDCGYMARAAFLMDKLMARCGLSGKSFIPMLSSVACAIPGVMATRVIEDRRDRLATILVAPLMSCSARLPVYTLMIGAFLPIRSEHNPSGVARWVPGAVMFALYAVGMVVAPLVALVLKRTLLRGNTPIFVMEMPLYKWPSPRAVLRRMVDSGWAFLYRAGTFILASMIVVWALLYFPATDNQGRSYEERITQLEESIGKQKEESEALKKQAEEGDRPAGLQARQTVLEAEIESVEEQIHQLQGEWKGRSILGRLGHAIEPVVRPLGWDWKIGMAALASFPAREVVVGTLGIIYNQGKVDTEEIRESEDVGGTRLGQALKSATWDQEPGRKVFSVPTALSLMVFFALCCQCASTLAVIKRETNSWRWPIFTFVYMTALAYVGALVTYQVGTWFSNI